MQSLALSQDCAESWCQPFNGSLISGISPLNFWPVAPTQDCKTEVAKLWVLPVHYELSVPLLTSKAVGFYRQPHQTASITSGKKYPLVKLQFSPSEIRGGGGAPARKATELPLVLPDVPVWSLSAFPVSLQCQKLLLLSILSNFILVLLRKNHPISLHHH